MKIAGGIYLERCISPSWHELFGSGGRAAFLLKDLEDNLELHTCLNSPHDNTIQARSPNLNLNFVESDQVSRFSYFHPLSVPRIQPAPCIVKKASKLIVEGEVILAFGMLEGNPSVHGNRVVYDPQSAYFRPVHFDANGSTAETLAIVANQSEVRALTSCKSAEPRLLLEESGAAVVVMKQGPLGSLVVTPEGKWNVPAYRRPGKRVFPIGSGDAFSAAFAHYWGTCSLDAHIAADKASRATAIYCSAPATPLRREILKDESEVEEIKTNLDDLPCQIYLASPFFNIAQLWLVYETKAALAGVGVNVFSPYHEIGIGSAEEVVEKDLAAIRKSHALFALVDGADPGTLFEVGYARARDIPVIALSESEPKEALKMLHGSGGHIHSDFATAVYHTIWAAMETA